MKTGLMAGIIIPNFNGRELLAQNLPQVLKEAKSAGLPVFICDDGSCDDSIALVNRHFPSITVFRSLSNQGFSSIINNAILQVKLEIIVLLNSDVRPEENFLSPLLKHFSDPYVFAVGCMDKSREKNNVILRGRGIGTFSRGLFIHRRGEIHRTNTLWVSGGSGAFRRSMWLELGGFDRIFSPFYYEDIDLSYRAQKLGYKVLFEPQSVVIHEHRKGSINKFYTRKFIKIISYRNQFTFIWKNVTSRKIILEHFLWLPYHFLKAGLRFDSAFFQGFIQAFFQILIVLKKRNNLSHKWKKSDQDIVAPYLLEIKNQL